MKTNDVYGLPVVLPEGEFIHGPEVDAVRAELARLSRLGHKYAIVDFRLTVKTNSTGLGMLVSWHTVFTEHGGHLYLVNAPDRVNHLLEITKLGPILEVLPDIPAVMNRLSTIDANWASTTKPDG